ncbi:MAG TPA: hypothetical protein VJ891_17695 [Casimicrobiaceae bacterium]|nr:hypothetical protein [Casimicrobiaceae bacterium]
MATTHTGSSTPSSQTHGSSTTGMQEGMMGQTPDITYDLISVMYHALQGCQAYEKYAQDAEHAGQQDVAQFFRDTGREFERCAQRGQQLLAQCLTQGQMGQGGRQMHSQMSSGSSQQSGGSTTSASTSAQQSRGSGGRSAS